MASTTAALSGLKKVEWRDDPSVVVTVSSMAAWKVALSVWRLAVQSDGEMVAWKVESRDVSMVA